MHFVIVLFSIYAVWRWADLKNWQLYHPTMLYMALGNAMYNFICAGYLLWELRPDFLPNHSLTEYIHTLITFPATALLFLSNYPKGGGRSKIALHYLLWIGLYAGTECFFTFTNLIAYNHGWNLMWSILFDCIMFPMLWLHSRYPLAAYALSIPISTILIMIFDVPVHLPIPQR
ncbi:hypothetical protein DNH61_24265 [Paenibacillus sambharensis]|uniref:Uncharacterized protein n=1 Tax=Paenibacillus sambharensis TaxID=1803190 RepID=A0A2W1L1C7_9BACL|nr:CBO0543 family protein [Paenibacillus sambharensis]PZD93166.1 hypothetical protein DNH61_24265 [Paenibacillus sambharensis]